ncbi:hypothetical protein [Tabrizicola aquatica]|uniref:hypothetical protein n=1 Tax=Tabrizicola aquatica TaxID=909926 RepID=UPI000CD17660|nr:hypothetical protein [Tabrizicola aquatica]
MKRLLIAALLLTTPALAEGSGDPTWPCIQRKQPHLSIGQLWPGPPPDAAAAHLAQRPDIAALAQVLEQRRLPMDEAEVQIAAFAKGASAAELTALFVAVFDRIDAYRSRIMAGVARYAEKQTALSDQIEARRAEMARLSAAAAPDFDKIDAEEERLDWDVRIFTDRQAQLTYVCETPVILEQRAFALGRAIAAHLATPTPVP